MMLSFSDFMKLKEETNNKINGFPNVGRDHWRQVAKKNPEVEKYVNTSDPRLNKFPNVNRVSNLSRFPNVNPK